MKLKFNSNKQLGFLVSYPGSEDQMLQKYYQKLATHFENQINKSGGIAGCRIKIYKYAFNSADQFFEKINTNEDIHFIQQNPYDSDKNLNHINIDNYFFFDDIEKGGFDPSKHDLGGKGKWNYFDLSSISIKGWRSELRSVFPDKKMYVIVNSSYLEKDRSKIHPKTAKIEDYLSEAKTFFGDFNMDIAPFEDLHLNTEKLKNFLKNLNDDEYVIVSNRIHPIDAQPGKEGTLLYQIEESVLKKLYDDVHLAYTSTESSGRMISIGLQNEEAFRVLTNKSSLYRKTLLSLKDPSFQSYIRLQDLYSEIDSDMDQNIADTLAENHILFDQLNLIKYIFDKQEYKYTDRASFLMECSKRLKFLNGIDDVFIGDNANLQFDELHKNIFIGSLLIEYRRNSLENNLIDTTLFKRQESLLGSKASASGVQVSYVNIDVLKIKDISIEEGTFVAKFYFELTTPFLAGIDILSFNNSTLDSTASIIKFDESNIDEEYYHFRYLVEDKFSFNPIADNYPFDSQMIFISYSIINPENHGLLQPIQRHDVDEIFELDGWHITSSRSGIFREKIKKKSTLGLPSVSVFETNRIGWILKRASSMTLLKVLIPLSFLWSLVIYGLFLPIENLDRSVGVITTSFLSAIALYFSTERPQPLKMTVIDYIFASFYLTVGASSIAVFSLNFFPDVYDDYMSFIKYLLPISAFFIFSFIRKRIRSKAYLPKMR